MFSRIVVIAIVLARCALAQFPPPVTDTTRIRSPTHKDVWVDFKPNRICETTAGVPNFAGYVHVPAGFMARRHDVDQHRDKNVFFWFFGARNDPVTAPLTVYFHGGPGAASTRTIFREHGPCRVELDGTSTRLNPWSWNEHSHMLYVDQPGNTGFSHDNLQNVSINAHGRIIPLSHDSCVPEQSRQFTLGTLGAGYDDVEHAFNSTASAARFLWEFLQLWLDAFPEYADNKVNIWTSSYGGHYAPALVNLTLAQNLALQSSNPETHYRHVNIDTLGINSGCMDIATQLPYYPEMAYRNTYGIELITHSAYNSAQDDLKAGNGCLDLVKKCRAVSAELDWGNNLTVNSICHKANSHCGKHIAGIAAASNYDLFNIGYPADRLSSPSMPVHIGYLAQASVQAAMGVHVNFTVNADEVTHAFARTGDNAKGGALKAIASALDHGVKVVLMHGDRDYACNWIGGEAAALAIPHRNQQEFAQAGYQEMIIDTTLVGAQVRQYGNFSFIRVNNAGHSVAADQPHVGLGVFDRANSGLDLATGTLRADCAVEEQAAVYSTRGTHDILHIRNQPPKMPEEMCHTLDLFHCTSEQRQAYLSGRGAVTNHWLIDYGNGSCSPNPVRPCLQKIAQPTFWYGPRFEEDRHFLVGCSGGLLLVGAAVLIFTSTLQQLKRREGAQFLSEKIGDV